MKEKILLFTILLLVFNQIPAQNTTTNDWFWQYPKPQGNTLHDIYVFDSTTAVAVGDLGTVIKTTDGGESWDIQHHTGGVTTNISSINFIDRMNGWAAAGVLLKTSDGGKTWTAVRPQTSLSLYAVYFVDADTGFAAGEDGAVLRTTDGGSTWDVKNMNDYIGGYLDVFSLNAITFTDKNTGYIVGFGYYGNQIYKTTDCGKTWQWNEHVILPKIFEGLHDIYFIDKNHGYITGDSNVFLRTSDGGSTWLRDTIGNYYCILHSVCFTDSLNGWSVGGDNEYDYYLGGVKFNTTDGGKSWFRFDTTMNFCQIYKVRFSGKNTGWIIGQDGFIYKTTDAGKSWKTQREENYGFNSVHFADENNGWAVGEKGIILHTGDGGQNWIKQNQNDSLFLESVFPIDKNNIIAIGLDDENIVPYDKRKAAFLLTSNGGTSWSRVSIDSSIRLFSVHFSSPKLGWIVGAGKVYNVGVIYNTTDGGLTWTLQFSSKNNYFYDVQFINDQIGWVAGDIVLKTEDGGKTWNSLNAPCLSFMDLFFADEKTGWLVGDNNGKDNIYKTTDGGKNWLPIGQTSGYYCSIYFINQSTGWITGYTQAAQQSIIKTTDGGISWLQQDSPSNYLTSLFFLNENIGWTAGAGLFKTINGGGTGILLSEKEIKNTLPCQIVLLQNYPNPFNPSTVISYQILVTDNVTLNVYDVLGRKIKTLVNEIKKPGNYTVKFDATGLSSGIYIYRITAISLESAEHYVKSAKMMLLK